MEPTHIERILTLWFDELEPADWFRSDPELDARIRERVGDLHARADTIQPEDVLDQADRALAAVILLDQVSRNLGRGTAAAFANDPKALSIARGAHERGLDASLSPEQRGVLWMPYMHAEDLAVQEQSVALFETVSEEQARYARVHRDLIARFGRFPYRNEVLGRTSTAEELAFLEDGPRFGQ